MSIQKVALGLGFAVLFGAWFVVNSLITLASDAEKQRQRLADAQAAKIDELKDYYRETNSLLLRLVERAEYGIDISAANAFMRDRKLHP